MNPFEKGLKRRIEGYSLPLSEITPSLAIEVLHRGKRRAHLRLGKIYSYYDIASLTKIIFTATAWIRWCQISGFDVNLPVYYFLPWWRDQKTTVFEVMTHTAGLVWWKPFYKEMHGPLDPQARWHQLQSKLEHVRPKRGKRAVYSDVDLMVLGFVLEELRQMSLENIWLEIKEDLKLKNTDFHIHNRPLHARGDYAPTERCSWRKGVLQGEVHDENAWALGGVAPHAGLFSTIEDLSHWALGLRKALRGEEERKFASASVVKDFVRRRIPRSKGDWGLCFMKPSQGRSSSGKHFSALSFGHTGFTGTSIWIDPLEDLIVIILANRVHPTRENRNFVQFRPQLHNWICELL